MQPSDMHEHREDDDTDPRRSNAVAWAVAGLAVLFVIAIAEWLA